MRKNVLIAATAIFASMTSAAYAEIKLGAILSVTGPASFMGEPERRTLEMFVDKINSSGGVNGEKIKLVFYDDGADANKARLMAQRLVDDDKVVAIIGSTLTGPSLAINDVAAEAKIPVMSLGGGVQIVEPVKPWMFKGSHTDRMACQKIFEDLKARNLTKVAIVSGTDGFGNSMRGECLKQAANYNITVAADERHGPQDSDITPQLTNVRAVQGLQAVVHTGFGETATVFARNYRQLGITVPLYESHGVAAPEYIKLTGPATEGVRLPTPPVLVYDQLAADDPLREGVTAYAKEYQAKYNQPASMFGAFAYDALMMLVDIYKKTKTTDPVKTRDAIEKYGSYKGVGGTINFTATDHLGLDLSAFHMVEIKDGKFVRMTK